MPRRFDNTLLDQCLTRDSALPVYQYDKLTAHSRITFICKCGEEGNKLFTNAITSGFQCTSCSLTTRGKHISEALKSKSPPIIKITDIPVKKTHRTADEKQTIFEKLLLDSGATLNEPVQTLMKNTRIRFVCQCGKRDDKTFIRIQFSGIYCKECTSSNRQQKRETTNIERYGTPCALQSESIKKKAEETCMARYGVKNAFQSEAIQNKIKEKVKQIYGVENPFASEEIKRRLRTTCEEKYGTPFPMQNKEVRNKVVATNMVKYGVPVSSKAECVKQKAIETNMKIYGAPSHTTVPEVIEKAKKTNLRKYGVEHSFQAESVKQKIKASLLKRYGVNHSMKIPSTVRKTKESFMRKFKVPHPLNLQYFRAKQQTTNIARYGVPHPMQSTAVQHRSQINALRFKTYTTPSGIQRNVQGYEPFALDKLFSDGYEESDVFTDRKDVPRIVYTHQGKTSYYFPDIWIKTRNTLIEVKSTWTYNLHYDRNVAKWNAAVAQGYAMEFWIFKPNKELTNITEP